MAALPSVKVTVTASGLDNDVLIRSAKAGDLLYILDRAKKWSNQQGFMPRANIEDHVRRGQALLCEVNGAAAGYLLISGGIRCRPVLRHNTVERDLWNKGLGEAGVGWLARWCGSVTAYDHLLIRTREDLDAQAAINRAVGGIVTSVVPHVGARGRKVYIWSVPCFSCSCSSFRFPPPPANRAELLFSPAETGGLRLDCQALAHLHSIAADAPCGLSRNRIFTRHT